MPNTNDRGSARNDAITESESLSSVPPSVAEKIQEHGRLAVFVEHPGKANYFSKSKKSK